MELVPTSRRAGSVVFPSFVFVLALAVVGASAAHAQVRTTSALALIVAAAVVNYRRLLAWRSLIALIVLTILFIPIKRYTLPAALPFNLEVYRIVVAGVVVLWVASLLIDPALRLRRSGLEAPLGLYLLTIVLSWVANPTRVTEIGLTYLVKELTFFVSFLIVFYMVVSLLRAPRDIDFVVTVLAGGGAVLGFLGVIESATGYNVFNHLSTVFPLLRPTGSLPTIVRGGRLRVYGSAQHPIAYGAALAMLVPLGIYKIQSTGQRRWWALTGLIFLGVAASRSRTAIVMLAIILLIYLLLRGHEMKRLWPAILPLLVAVHFALPGAIGTAYGSFFPQGGLVAQQQDASVGSGRLATLGPVLHSEYRGHELVGEGFATRITGAPEAGEPAPNGPILDDAWLGVLLETGAIGAAMLLWVFLRSLRRMGGAARRDHSARGALLVAIMAAVASYGVGMFTYDATGFVQVSFLLYIMLALGMTTVLSSPQQWQRIFPALRRKAVRAA
jgi:polysaccharide biosynthesis protein PslJ